MNTLVWYVAPLASLVALVVATFFFKSMQKASPGNARMQEIAGPNPQLTRIEGVTMRNVRCDWALRGVTLLCDPDYPARNFRLENVVIDEVFEKFAAIENVDGIKFDVTAKRIHPDAHG